jgi:sugar/nucleoside kinase (ribokinase family)
MIVGIGSLALDTTRTPFDTVQEVLGGAIVNFSLASCLFGVKTGIVGVIGTDFPKDYYDILDERLDLRGLKIEEGKTFRFESTYDHSLSSRYNTKTHLGVMEGFTPSLPEAYQDAEFVYLGTNEPTQNLELLKKIRSPRLTACDTIELWIETMKEETLEVMSKVDCVILNDDETRLLCGTPNLLKGGKTILEWGTNTKHVIIKKGEHGALLVSKDGIFPSSGYPLEEIVDPTGAGDAFAGGFLGHIARSTKNERDISIDTIKEAMAYGHIIGSFVVEEFSVKKLLDLTLEEIEQRYSVYKEMCMF